MSSMLNFVGVCERKLKWVTTQVDLILTETAFCLPVSHFDILSVLRGPKYHSC